MLFFEISFSIASRQLFIFICISTGHIHFCRDEICISREPGNLRGLPRSCIMPKQSTIEKPDLNSVVGEKACMHILRPRVHNNIIEGRICTTILGTCDVPFLVDRQGMITHCLTTLCSSKVTALLLNAYQG